MAEFQYVTKTVSTSASACWDIYSAQLEDRCVNKPPASKSILCAVSYTLKVQRVDGSDVQYSRVVITCMERNEWYQRSNSGLGVQLGNVMKRSDMEKSRT